MYNIHPIFVHFPIAFLVLYSIVKIIPLEKWFPTVNWKPVEWTLLFFGVLGAFIASSTGETAEEISRPDRNLVEMHSNFAAMSTWVYGLLLAGEILLIGDSFMQSKFPESLKKIVLFIRGILMNKIIVILLSVIGLICISVTGLLGGVMVYGVGADPIAPFIMKLLGLS